MILTMTGNPSFPFFTIYLNYLLFILIAKYQREKFKEKFSLLKQHKWSRLWVYNSAIQTCNKYFGYLLYARHGAGFWAYGEEKKYGPNVSGVLVLQYLNLLVEVVFLTK